MSSCRQALPEQLFCEKKVKATTLPSFLLFTEAFGRLSSESWENLIVDEEHDKMVAVCRPGETEKQISCERLQHASG